MARSLGLVPPKETRTRTLGKRYSSLAAVMQLFSYLPDDVSAYLCTRVPDAHVPLCL